LRGLRISLPASTSRLSFAQLGMAEFVPSRSACRPDVSAERTKLLKHVTGTLLTCMALLPSVGSALNYPNRSIGQLQATYASGDCIFFTLVGVAEADPVRTGEPWFAIARSQFGAKDAYAMLLSAKLSEQAVTVRTSGALACGYASVESVLLP